MRRFSLSGVDDNIDVGGSNSASQSVIPKKRRTGLPPTNQSTTATTIMANVSAATVPVNDNILDLVDDDDDIESVDAEHDQLEGEEELGDEGFEDGEGAEEGDCEEYQTDQDYEGSGDMVRDDVSSGNSAGSCGTKSSMLGTFSDLDVLDCSICYEALTIPVFQCENGHLACSSCCIKIKKCPSCSWPIGYNRCRSIESILDSVQFSCPNLEYGCKETMLYSKREEHAKACISAPCSCPHESCDFVGSPEKLYAHFSETHLGSAVQIEFECPTNVWLKSNNRSVIFQEISHGTIFILNQSRNADPRAVNLIHIGALHSKEEYCYKLSVIVGDSTLELKSVAATMPKWSDNQPLRKYLLLPSDFDNSGNHTRVIVYIERR